MNHVHIESFHGRYRFLSNFWPTPVVFQHVLYPTAEHAYQAAKTLVPVERARILIAPTPGRAKRLGRAVTLQPEWADPAFRVETMYQVVKAKFADADLRGLLAATAPAVLIEGNTWGDRFWGVCGGVGENWLGRVLMRVRDEAHK